MKNEMIIDLDSTRKDALSIDRAYYALREMLLMTHHSDKKFGKNAKSSIGLYIDKNRLELLIDAATSLKETLYPSEK